jgi:prolipoprotein diacylglyceryltransferase
LEFTLLWAALTGIGFLWAGTRIWPQGLPDHPADRLAGAAAGGLLMGRLVAMGLQGTNPLLHPGDVLVVRGGVHTGTATIGAIGLYVWSVKGDGRYLDSAAPAALLGLAGWHAGCLWRNACLGTATELPWAWSLPGSSVTRHPVELYTAIGLAVAAILVSRLPGRTWLPSGVALASASLLRLTTQPLRLTLGGGPVGWYLAGLVFGLALAAWVRWSRQTAQPAPT